MMNALGEEGIGAKSILSSYLIAVAVLSWPVVAVASGVNISSVASFSMSVEELMHAEPAKVFQFGP